MKISKWLLTAIIVPLIVGLLATAIWAGSLPSWIGSPSEIFSEALDVFNSRPAWTNYVAVGVTTYILGVVSWGLVVYTRRPVDSRSDFARLGDEIDRIKEIAEKAPSMVDITYQYSNRSWPYEMQKDKLVVNSFLGAVRSSGIRLPDEIDLSDYLTNQEFQRFLASLEFCMKTDSLDEAKSLRFFQDLEPVEHEGTGDRFVVGPDLVEDEHKEE